MPRDETASAVTGHKLLLPKIRGLKPVFQSQPLVLITLVRPVMREFSSTSKHALRGSAEVDLEKSNRLFSTT